MTSVAELLGIRVVRDGRVVLDVGHLHVAQGEVLAIIGPNGAGKSSLLRIVGALESPAAGTVRFQGEPVVAESDIISNSDRQVPHQRRAKSLQLAIASVSDTRIDVDSHGRRTLVNEMRISGR